MIFSAVALVAFSFAGMANEIEEKKVENEKVKIVKKTLTEPTEFDKGYCTAVADLAEQNSGQAWTYTKWLGVYNKCIEKRTKTISPN